MDIAILLYDRFTALDAVGPYETPQPPARRRRSPSSPPSRARCAPTHGSLAMLADAHARRAPPPRHRRGAGRPRHGAAMATDEPTLDWLREPPTRRTQWTTSVCTGSLVLAAAGMLDGVGPRPTGRRSTTLAATGRGAGATSGSSIDGKIVTAAGVSAGIDMGLTLAARVARRRRRPGHPARHRVRPAAALRRRLARAKAPRRDRRGHAGPGSRFRELAESAPGGPSGGAYADRP